MQAIYKISFVLCGSVLLAFFLGTPVTVAQLDQWLIVSANITATKQSESKNRADLQEFLFRKQNEIAPEVIPLLNLAGKPANIIDSIIKLSASDNPFTGLDFTNNKPEVPVNAINSFACSTSINLGDTFPNALSTTDCVADGKYVDVYMFSGTNGQNVALSMNSTAFATRLELYNPSGQLIAFNSPGGGSNSRITLTLPASGTYRIHATSILNNRTGAYTISLGIPNCITTQVSLGQQTSQTLGASDCFESNRYFDRYTFNGIAGQSIRINMGSSQFVTRIDLFGPLPNLVPLGVSNGIPGGVDAMIEFVVPASGTYLVLASTPSEITAGAYNISFHTFCPVTPISVGQTVNNLSLSASDCLASGRFYDDYMFTGVQGQKIIVLMAVSNMSTRLQLYDPNDQVLVERSDAFLEAGTGLMYTLPSNGIYRIRASSLLSNQTGNYSLALLSDVPCPRSSLSRGHTIVGSLSNTDCRSVSGFADEFSFTANAGEKVAITLTSIDFNTRIRLFNSTGQEIRQAVGTPNSLLLFTVPTTGTYSVQVSSLFINRTGAYTVTLVDKDLPCTTTQIVTGETIERLLLTTDCVTESGYSDDYVFSAIQGQTMVITMDSIDFATRLRFPDQNTQIPGLHFAGDGSINSRLTFTMPFTGNISIRATSSSTLREGKYILDIRIQSPPANDNFANAQHLATFGEIEGSTLSATRESSEPLHAAVPGANSLWYRWRAPAHGLYTFTLGGSRFDTLLAIYTGTDIGNLTPVTSNDNALMGTFSRLAFTAVANTDYWIAIDGRAGSAGSGFFKMIYCSSDYVPGYIVSGTTRSDGGATARNGVTIVAKNLTEEIIATTISNSNGEFSIVIPQGVNSFKLAAFNHNEVYDFKVFLNITESKTHHFVTHVAGGGATFNAIGSLVGVNSAIKPTVTATVAGVSSEPVVCFVPASGDTYNCPGLLPYGTYRISPSHPSVTFSPASASLVNLASNAIGVSFVNSQAPGHRIRGRIMHGNTPLSGVKLTVTVTLGTAFGESRFETFTDPSGNYSFGPLPAGNEYVITASMLGFSLQPIGSTIFSNLQSDQTVNFSGISNCSYTLSQLHQTFPASGGSGSFSITTVATCPWQAITASSGIDVTSSLIAGPGTIYYFASPNSGPSRTGTITVAGQTFTINQAAATAGGSVLFDYDADGRADLSVYRPSDNIWYLLRGTSGYTTMGFGVSGDLIAPADYDGDAKTDIAVFRPSDGTWYFFNSATQSFSTAGWGQSGDIPAPADHDGDGKADLVVFRPSTGTWFTMFNQNGSLASTGFGTPEDKPVVGDFDGDGRADIGVFRPSDNNWYVLRTTTGFSIHTWGVGGDIPVPADYDGDGKTDLAVFRPSTGQWFRNMSLTGIAVSSWGQNLDIPVAADYDGDGKADIAVFRPSNGTWYIVGSTAGIMQSEFGTNGDFPTPSAFNY